MRAAFVVDGTVWGALILVRTAKQPDFTDRDNEIKGELRDGTKYRVSYVKEDAPNVINKLPKSA